MIKQYQQSDHAMLAEWWKTHYWPVVPHEALPTTGYISYVNKKPVLTGFIYLAKDTRMIAWVEFIVSNPDATFEERTDAWHELMAHIDDVARLNDVKMLFTVSDNENFIKRMQLFGYKPTAKLCTQMMKILDDQTA